MEEKLRYYHINRKKFSLKIHVVLATKYRRKIFFGNIKKTLKQSVKNIADMHNWKIIATETDKDHIHILLEYDTKERVCDIVGILKQYTSYTLYKKFNSILKEHYKHRKGLWSDGYFVCSVGEISSKTAQDYINSQG